MRFDQQARGMRPDKTVLLSASAGSGKTFVLVGRMLHLLAAGAAPESIAAITFTEKAAAQMKDKLFDRLARSAWAGWDVRETLELLPSDMPYPIRKTPEDVFSALVADPDALRISTIHAFCLGLLRRYPLEAGLPAEFSLLDETESIIRKERAVEYAVEYAASDRGDAGDAFGTLLRSGLTVDGVTGLLDEALGRRGILGMAVARAGGFAGLLESIDAAMTPGGKELAARAAVEGGEVADAAGRLRDMVAGLDADLPKYTDALEMLSALRRFEDFPDAFTRSRGAFYTKEMAFLAPRSVKPGKTAIESALKLAEPSLKGASLKARAASLKDGHDGLYNGLRDRLNLVAALHDDFTATRALMALLRMYKIAEESYRADNHREGFVDFDDLEIHTYRLLSGPDGHGVLEGMGQKVLHYMVDEFQDTNTLQWGIVERLASEVFAGQGAEGVSSPTLFAVGDTKQSIYRFRDADYHLMDALREKMQSRVNPDRLELPDLDYNFRCAPEVLKVVDETFGVLMQGYRQSVAVRAEAKGSVTLRVVHRDGEPAALADAITEALGMTIWDEATAGLRAAGYGDMAVLLRSRSGLGAYESALRAKGIPFKVVGGVGFFRQPEVRAVMGILGWLDNPGDRLALATALKSPLFRMSDGELEPIYRADDPLAALGEVLPDAQALFSAWRGRAGLVPVGSLVSDIVRDSSALLAFGVPCGSGGPCNPGAALNIEKLLGLAHAFDMRGGVGLSEFTEWVAEYREKSDLPTADVELPGFERFVSIMTVHAAKGLEFPVVFLPGAARGTRKGSPGLLVGVGEDGTLDMAVGTGSLLGDNPRYAALKETENTESLGEAARLLYVAMTRARDHLHIIAGDRPGKDGSFVPGEGTWAGMLFRAAPASLFAGGPATGEMPAVYRYPADYKQDEEHSGTLTPGPSPTAWRGEDKVETPPAPLPPSPAGGEGEERKVQRQADYSRLAARLAPLPVPLGVTFRSPSGLGGGHIRESKPTTVDAPEQMQTGGESAGLRDALHAQDAVARGLLIHAALESFGRAGSYGLAGLARGIPATHALGGRESAALVAGVEKTLARLFADNDIRGLLSPGPGKYFELPLLLRRDAVIIGGSADLVVVEGDAAKVIDYKTGMSDMSVDALRAAYAPQLSAYRDAVREAFGLREVSAYLLLVDRVELVPVILT